MANRQNKFLIKRSNVVGKVPTAGDLLLGEMALNTADVILYTSGTTENSILPIGWDRIARTGDTVNGNLTITGTTQSETISATTYLNLPLTIFGQGFSFQENTTSVNSNSTAGYTTNNLTVVGHTYTVNAPVDGTYKFGVKYNYTTNSISRSSKFRWYLDGVAQSRITEIEIKDATNDMTWADFFYATLTAGNHTLELRLASENTAMTITLSSSAVEFWRVT
jgi:hypothetical protein